ncbi:hypothetical protein L7F22_010294 [Adiantum nelumboides]|nr:hypothetical protein [Adiantum nelumboides]
MTCSKIDALWKCMAFPSFITELDICLIFVAEEMQSNAQPRIDWFRSLWDDNRRESMLAEGDAANACDSTNQVHEDIPDFQPGDPYLPLVHSCSVNAIALTRMDEGSESVGVESTQEGDLPIDDNNFPLATLRAVLCNISIELQGDNPANQRPLHVEMTSRFDDLKSVLENVSMDDLAMQITILKMHIENLSKQSCPGSADIIKEDLWPNPLKYFNNEGDDDADKFED